MCFWRCQEAEKDECFKVILTEASGGAKLGRIHKSIITIVNDDGKFQSYMCLM